MFLRNIYLCEMGILSFIKSLFGKNKVTVEAMKKYLIVGLGNIGSEYDETRHNIGFKILDTWAESASVAFENQKLGAITTLKIKGRSFILLKPATFMNLSGKAVKYWMTKEKIALDQVLIICDDLNLPFGTIRIKAKGNDGGHNGLKNINAVLNTQQYARFRFGIGASFSKGAQSNFVLGKWDEQESEQLPERIALALEAIQSFGLAGIKNTMNTFNGK